MLHSDSGDGLWVQGLSLNWVQEAETHAGGCSAALGYCSVEVRAVDRGGQGCFGWRHTARSSSWATYTGQIKLEVGLEVVVV